MDEFPKIDTIWKRSTEAPNKGKVIEGQFSNPEIDYLATVPWEWTEKVDGTNVRVGIHLNTDDDTGPQIEYGGRTKDAQMPVFLVNWLRGHFEAPGFDDRIWRAFEPALDPPPDTPSLPLEIVLYGEGYGAKIQKGGGNYKPDGVSFVLFDVKVGNWWLQRENVEEIANNLDLEVVPVVATVPILDPSRLPMSLSAALWPLKEVLMNFFSGWEGVTDPEGLVGRPVVPMFNRRGHRIMTKIKRKDYR